MVARVVLDELAKDENFTEEAYLRANPDVAAAVSAAHLGSGREHFERYGRAEGRRLRFNGIESLRARKFKRYKPFLRTDMVGSEGGGKCNYLSDELRAQTKIIDTNAVSGHHYDLHGMALIQEFHDGLVLDCGAGRRPIYFENVVNLEIVDYDTTDVVAVGEALPFVDNTFDAIISVAVLEHVRDPFRCAREIARVLKPGGKLYCSVPFLQPEHGYPHHYYNMAPQGLRALFEDMLTIDDQIVPDALLPLWTLTWFVGSWAAGLGGEAKRRFESLTISEILAVPPATFLKEPWVSELSSAKNFELACGTSILAHK